mmetsp:Transcript_25162/g.79687  ORF Transcript_25162/g.79687 Transcript_25162/m.79687 type:complete len:381 (+) Transcript_25162:566-1708(+)
MALFEISRGKLYCIKHRNIRNLRYKFIRVYPFVKQLQKIAKSSIATSVAFYAGFGDNPRIIRSSNSSWFPYFSVSSSPIHSDLPVIPFSSFGNDHAGFSEYSWEREKIQSLQTYPTGIQWLKRIPNPFFKGGLSDCNGRGDAIAAKCPRAMTIFRYQEMSRDLKLCASNRQGVKSLIKRFGKVNCSTCVELCMKKEKYYESMLKYKYSLVMDGAGPWSRRMQENLLSGSTILRHDNHGYQFYEMNFKPYVHYVPFNYSNLDSVVEFLSNNDELAATIANRGASFAKTCLTSDQIQLFLTLFLSEYVRRVGSNVGSRGQKIDISANQNDMNSRLKQCFEISCLGSKCKRPKLTTQEKMLQREFRKEERDITITGGPTTTSG